MCGGWCASPVRCATRRDTGKKRSPCGEGRAQSEIESAVSPAHARRVRHATQPPRPLPQPHPPAGREGPESRVRLSLSAEAVSPPPRARDLRGAASGGARRPDARVPRGTCRGREPQLRPQRLRSRIRGSCEIWSQQDTRQLGRLARRWPYLWPYGRIRNTSWYTLRLSPHEPSRSQHPLASTLQPSPSSLPAR